MHTRRWHFSGLRACIGGLCFFAPGTMPPRKPKPNAKAAAAKAAADDADWTRCSMPPSGITRP